MKSNTLKVIVLFMIMAHLPFVSKAQQWSGNSNINDNLYRLGNVGIGTTTPSSNLHLFNSSSYPTRLTIEDSGSTGYTGADILLKTTTSSIRGLGLYLFNSPASANWYSGTAYSDASKYIIGYKSGGAFDVTTAELANAIFTINNNGNVGIGTTSPIGRFEVLSTDSKRYVNFKAPNGENRFEFYVGSTGNAASFKMYDMDGTSNRIKLSAGGGTSFINSGNVGIGTTNPSAKLSVHGSLSTISDYGYAAFENSEGKGLSIGYDDTNLCTWFYSRDVGTARRGMQFDANKFIFSNGNVGIGTTTTGSHKLAVAGSIGAHEIIVETGSWSDFVFADNYQLKPLSEVESYIKENKHLPDIPSEKEVKENGVNVGEMNAKLLQKIEELTLYVIEQNKKIESLQRQINNQNN